MTLTEKVSYIKGLMEGINLDDSTNEGKVLVKITALLDDMAKSIEALSEEVDEVVELVDILDEDLYDLEQEVYDFDSDDDDDFDDDDCDCCDDEAIYEVICPSCGDTICLNEELIEEGSIACPNCDENLEFDFDLDEDTTGV